MQVPDLRQQANNNAMTAQPITPEMMKHQISMALANPQLFDALGKLFASLNIEKNTLLSKKADHLTETLLDHLQKEIDKALNFLHG